MPPVPFDQLPKRIQQQVVEQERPANANTGTGRSGSPQLATGTGACWRCYSCQATFTKWAPAERHGSLAGHHQIEFVLR